MHTCTVLQTNGNTQDILVLYQENLARIYHFVYLQLKNQQVAEDLTAQVFLKAIPLLADQPVSQSMDSWLLQIAHTTVIDYWRATQHLSANPLDALIEAGWEIPAQDAIAATNSSPAERVQRILQQLPRRQREVLTYRFLLKLTVSEAAQLMGMAETTVKKLQFDALNRAASLESAMIDGG